MAALDLKQFRKDVKVARAGREAAKPGRPATTGAMGIVRDNLDLFDRMRAGDATLTWADIAVSLARQGIVQRDGQPMTAKRLCALVSTIRRQQTAREHAQAQRSNRADVAAADRSRLPSRDSRKPGLALSPDLVAADAEAGQPPTTTEKDHRRAAFDRAKTILKRD